MEQLAIGKNTVTLKFAEATTYTVKLSLIDELSGLIKINGEATSVDATSSDAGKTYTAEITLPDNIKSYYPRGIWDVTDSSSNKIPIQPTEYELIASGNIVQLVTSQYLIDYVLNSELDMGFKASIKNYAAKNPEGLRTMLQAATRDIGTALKTTLYPVRYENEKHDYFKQDFHTSFWMIQVYHKPLIEIIEYNVYFGQKLIMKMNPEDQLVVDKEQSTVEFLPVSIKGIEFFPIYLQALSALQIGFTNFHDRLPGFFHITYDGGIDFMNLDKSAQESYRHAISREAILKNAWRLIPNIFASSISKSVDGASKSQGFAGIPALQMLNGIQTTWIDNKLRELGTNIDMII